MKYNFLASAFIFVIFFSANVNAKVIARIGGYEITETANFSATTCFGHFGRKKATKFWNRHVVGCANGQISGCYFNLRDMPKHCSQTIFLLHDINKFRMKKYKNMWSARIRANNSIGYRPHVMRSLGLMKMGKINEAINSLKVLSRMDSPSSVRQKALADIKRLEAILERQRKAMWRQRVAARQEAEQKAEARLGQASRAVSQLTARSLPKKFCLFSCGPDRNKILQHVRTQLASLENWRTLAVVQVDGEYLEDNKRYHAEIHYILQAKVLPKQQRFWGNYLNNLTLHYPTEKNQWIQKKVDVVYKKTERGWKPLN